jgi:hypothetical protein
MTKQIVWIDSERAGEEVETQEETAKRLGLKVTTLQSYIRLYPDQYPTEIAYLMPTRLRLRSVKELEKFFEWKASKPRFRKGSEVIQGEVVRLERSLEMAEKRKKRAEFDLDEANREVTRLRASLRKEKEYLGILAVGESGE